MVDLKAGVVRILDQNSATVGTGFLVSADGRIATCAHVVKGTQPHVAFPDCEPRPTQVVATDEVHDVAILRVESNLPPGAVPARLGRSADGRYHEFRSRGYRPLGGMEGIPAEGKVLDAVSECPGVQHEPLLLQTQHVRGGMSGAPVYIPDLDLVVGMITGYWDSLMAQTGFSDRDTALATPSEAIAALCPDLRLEDPLADFRRRVLEETRLVNLAGVPLPRDRAGQPIPLEVPLDRVYICIQAMPEEQRREEREAERRAVEEGAERGGLFRSFLSPGRKSPGARPRRPSPADVLAVLRTLGEYFYQRGEVYQAAERPEPVDPQAALKEKGRLVILGAPGAGKTTLLRYLARRAADDPRGPVPILVSLRNYAAHRGAGGQQTLQAFALERASRRDPVQRRALEAAVRAGQALWLADALDEARGWREEAAREVAALPGRLVLTSRPVGYERAGLERLPHFEVLPLAPQETDKFVRDWFGLLAEGRGEGEDWIEARAAWLRSQMADRPRIAPLTHNPLLLTFLAVLAGEELARDLPVHRAELYRRYVEELLATWEVRRRPREGAEGQPALRLGPLAGEEARAATLDGFTRLGWRLHLTYYGGQGAALPVWEELKLDLARAATPLEPERGRGCCAGWLTFSPTS